MANAFKDIITRLERQRSAIDQALAALRNVEDTGEGSSSGSSAAKTKRKSKRRKISDEARARIVEGQKRRWAAKRAAEKSGVKKAARKRSAAKTAAKGA